MMQQFIKKSVCIAILLSSFSLWGETIQVFKPIASTCPQNWLDDIKKVANEVKIVNLRDVKRLKHEIGIPYDLRSCNTSMMGDYIFEGNVPLKAIKDFLKKVPKNALGLSLPAWQNDKKVKTVFVLFKDKSYKEFGKY
jgi:hypothetical protein